MKSESRIPQCSHLPKELYKFFWDYIPAKLSWKTDQELIIRRILTNGSWKAIVWLRKQMGDEALREWLRNHRGRGLSPRQIRFWELLLNLPQKQTNDWIQAAQLTPWGQK